MPKQPVAEVRALLMVTVQAKRCRVVMHPSCMGLPGIPEGRWYCPEHAEEAKQHPPKPPKGGEKKPKGDGAKGSKGGKKRERSVGEQHARGEDALHKRP